SRKRSITTTLVQHVEHERQLCLRTMATQRLLWAGIAVGKKLGGDLLELALCNWATRSRRFMKHHGSLYQVLELTNIARPMIALRRLYDRLHQTLVSQLPVIQADSNLVGQVPCQHGQIGQALPQGGQMHQQDIQAVIQILTK